MFEFKSKPIQITNNLVLCQDGSIWQMKSDGIVQVGVYKKQSSPVVKTESHYTEEFNKFWALWNQHINNQSTKRPSFLSYKKLSAEDKKALSDSVIPYSKTNNDHQYLKRCETYINQRHWESLQEPVNVFIDEEPINRNIDLRGAF